MTELALAPSVEGAVSEAKILIRIIDKYEVKAAVCWWELADLSASQVNEHGKNERLTLSEWAAKIGWTKEKGKSTSTLSDVLKICRAWPEDLRCSDASFWQHREALKMFDGNVEEASVWLHSADRPRSVRDVSRSGIHGTGAIFDAIRKLMRARSDILRVPVILAAGNITGRESNFDQLRTEVARVKKGMAYLDRYIKDETEIDMDELTRGLNKILKEAAEK
jgi:hypothetical protein